MFCESCGAALKDGAKFCGSCGSKVTASATASSSSVVNSIKLAALPAGLANCEINIKSVTAEGPDSDGDLSISITYEVANKSDEDWEYLSVRTQLLNAAGQIVEDTQDTHEQSFDAGDTEELQASFYRVKAKFLGENPEKAHLVINAVASTLIQQKLGQVDIPANAFEVTALKPTKLGESVQLISGSLWKTEPDDDKDSRVEVKALIQNLTDKHLPLVKIAAEVKDKKGNEVADAGGSEEVRPGSIVTVSGSGYTKDKKLIGAKADLAVLVYTPVAAGVSQCQGVTVTAIANEDNEEDERTVLEGESGIKQYQGNLFKITITRIPEGQEFDEPLSAVNGNVDAPVFAVGIIHAFKDGEDGDRHYIAYSNNKIISECEDLDEMVDDLRMAASNQIDLDEKELSQLGSIFAIQEDADYDLDEDIWSFSLGDGGEVRLSEDFAGAILVNVTPLYSTEITLEGTYGVADDDSCCEDHEFCGAMRCL